MKAGWLRRQERLLDTVAWAVSHLVNMSGKSLKKGVTVSPDKLLGRKPTRATRTVRSGE